MSSYASGIAFGPMFIAVSLPFYAFALWRVGWRFTLKSLVAVALFSAMVELAPPYISVAPTNPFLASALGGLLAGSGLLALFRHGASLGGIGVVAVWLQDATGFRAGWTQMSVDAAVFSAAFLIMPWQSVLASLLGAAILNLVIALNHRRDYYVAL